MKQKILLLALLLSFVFTMGASAQNRAVITVADMLEIAAISRSAEINTFLQLLAETDLLETLDDTDTSITLFAPSDLAFDEFFEQTGYTLDTLLDDPDLSSEILLYHMIENTEITNASNELQEFKTYSGSSISVTKNRLGNLMVNQYVIGNEPDYEANNGVIYFIGRVLLPSNSAILNHCVVSTNRPQRVEVRVGPGENRTAVAFLPADAEFEVIGQALDNEGDVWFKLDRDEVTPSRSNAEAWIAADDVQGVGNCNQVVDVSAPPIIPIAIVEAAPETVETTETGGDTTDTSTDGTNESTTTADGQFILQAGLWTETFDSEVQASCHGIGNVSIPITDLLDSNTYSYNLSLSDTGFSLDSDAFDYIGHNTYQARDTSSGTWYVQVTSPTHMESYYVVSFYYTNCSCTASIHSVINH